MKTLLIVVASVVATLGAMAAVGFALRGNALGSAEPPTTVRVEPATRGALVELVSVPGEIQPEQKVQISSRVPAQILALPHKEGDPVARWDAKSAGATASADPRAVALPPPPPATRPSVAAPAGPLAEPPEASVLVRLDARDLEATLKSAEARAAAQAAEADVSRARIEAQRSTIAATAATLADAERDLRRQVQLLETQDVAQQAVDQAQTKVTELRSQLAAAGHGLAADEASLVVLGHNLTASRADIDKVREQLSYTVITSPIDGTIIKLNSKVGESVVPGIQGSPGSVILEVADLSRMLMIGQVDESSVASVKPGQRATVRMQAYRDEAFEGTVQSVALAKADARQLGQQANRSLDGANYYEARILLKTDGRRILTGLTADADIETSRREGVKVPSQAVLGRQVDSLPEAVRSRPEVEQGKQFTSVVYRHVDGKAVVTPVKVGASDETHTLILSGLTEGDAVVVGPFKILDTLKDGQAVTVEAGGGGGGASSKPATRESGGVME